MSEETSLKVTCGLGAGMGRKGEVCGAVTGGILVLGMRHGTVSKDFQSATDLTYLKTRELMDLFAARHGSWICRRLLDGCDLATEAGQQQFKANEMRSKVCKYFVKSVVEILEDRKLSQAG